MYLVSKKCTYLVGSSDVNLAFMNDKSLLKCSLIKLNIDALFVGIDALRATRADFVIQ